MAIKVFKTKDGKIITNAAGGILQIDLNNINQSGVKALKGEEGKIFVSPEDSLLVMQYEAPEDNSQE